MFLSLVLTPCLAENMAGWQEKEMHHSSIVFPLSSSHTGSQTSGHPRDQRVWSLPVNLVLAEPWSRALPHCPGQHRRPATETLLPETSCHWFPALFNPAQWDLWMRSSVGHVCEF